MESPKRLRQEEEDEYVGDLLEIDRWNMLQLRMLAKAYKIELADDMDSEEMKDTINRTFHACVDMLRDFREEQLKDGVQMCMNIIDKSKRKHLDKYARHILGMKNASSMLNSELTFELRQRLESNVEDRKWLLFSEKARDIRLGF